MVDPTRNRQALYSLHLVLIYARTLAYEGTEHERLAKVLDWAELLPSYLDATRDRTSEFRESLAEMTTVDPRFNRALAAFEADDVPFWHGEDR